MTKAEERALEAYPEDIQLFVESQETPGKWLPVDNNLELRVGYQKGYEQAEKDIKEQMMKEAVEADVMLTLHDKTGDISLHTGYLPKELGIKCDDKVRIIIVKED